MLIRRQFRAAIAGLCIGLWGLAHAAAPPDIPVTTTAATGMAGSTVKPSFSFDVNGFDFEAFDLTLTFTDPVLSFDLGSSTASYNGNTMPWANLLAVFLPSGPSAIGDVGTFQFSAFSLAPESITGALVLQPAFQIRNGAPLGNTTVTVSGSIGSEPLVGERYFSSDATITVSAVPEPELWLLWLGGIGLLAWKKRSRLKH